VMRGRFIHASAKVIPPWNSGIRVDAILKT
jgi:hypothetical protein